MLAYGILMLCDICYSDWFNKEADWPIAGRQRLGRTGIKGEHDEGEESWEQQGDTELGDEFQMLRKGTESLGRISGRNMD